MKKIVLVLAVVFAVSSVKAQDGKMNVVKVNPLGLLFGNAGLSYERALTAKSSVQINGNFGGLSVGGVKYTSFGAGADYKFYLSNSKEAPAGFYAAPGAAFYSTKVKETGGTSFTGSGAVIRGLIGNQWIWDSGFSLDLFGGVNYYLGGSIKGTGGVEYTKFSGVLPALGVGIGYAF